MDLSLKGKRAIVCGSTQGIGKSIAIKLAEHGAAITLIARNEKKLIDVIGELKNTSSMEHNFIVSDFNDLNTLEKKFTDFINKDFKPTILINNTGGPPPGEISKANKKDLDLIFETCDYAVKSAIKKKNGVIGRDEEKNNSLSCIDFNRIKGGKNFDTTAEWYVKMIKDINTI